MVGKRWNENLWIVLLLVVLSGCAYNAQNFNTDNDSDGTTTTYFEPVQQPDGTWVALVESHTVDTNRVVVTGKNKSTAPPFNSKNNADAHLDMEEGVTAEGLPLWKARMGQTGEIEGGDIAPALEVVGDSVVGGLTAGASTMIENLTEDN